MKEADIFSFIPVASSKSGKELLRYWKADFKCVHRKELQIQKQHSWSKTRVGKKKRLPSSMPFISGFFPGNCGSLREHSMLFVRGSIV